MTQKRVLLINGPNLNLLGTREPEIYGSTSLETITSQLEQTLKVQEISLMSFQSNHEGEIIDFIQQNSSTDYAIINLGALTHTSIAIYDVLKSTGLFFIEVHISNIYAREEYRKKSMISSIAQGIIIGCGIEGYDLAADLIIKRIAS